MNAMTMIKSMRDAHVVLVGDMVRLFRSESSAAIYLITNVFPEMLDDHQQGLVTKEELDGYPGSYYGKHYMKLSEYLSQMNREEMTFALISLMLERMEEDDIDGLYEDDDSPHDEDGDDRLQAGAGDEA